MDSVGTGADGAAQPRGQNRGRGLKAAHPVNGAKAQNGEGHARAKAVLARLKALETEVQARRAEARWLHAHYGERLRELVGEVAALSARVEAAEQAPEPERGGGSAGASPEAEAQAALLAAELEKLKAEHERQKAANERYLARIYELKRALQAGDAESQP